MGVSDNMLHEEISKVASGGHSEGRMGRMVTENGHFDPVPKYKSRRVSAVRDFPPGCGRLAAPITSPSEQAPGQVVYESEQPTSLSNYADKVQCEETKVSGASKPPGHGRLAAPISNPSEQAPGQVVSDSEQPASLSDCADKVQCEETNFSGDSEPPGHGRLAAPITSPSEQAPGLVVSASEQPASLSDYADKVQCEETKASGASEPPEHGRLAASITSPIEQGLGQVVPDSEQPASLSDYADKVQCEETKVSGAFEPQVHGRLAAPIASPNEQASGQVVPESEQPASLSDYADKVPCEETNVSGASEPPGYRRLAAPIASPIEQAPGQVVPESEQPSSLSDYADKVQCEETKVSGASEPPGYRRLAAPITSPSEQATGQVVSESENPALSSNYADKASGDSETATCLVNEVSDSHKDLPEESVAIPEEEEVPERGESSLGKTLKRNYRPRKGVSAVRDFPEESIAIPEEEEVPERGESSLGKTLKRNYRPRKGVSAVRDFPPFCGRNAPPLSEEERTKWLSSLKDKGFDVEKFVNKEKPLEKTLWTDVIQVIEDIQDIHALDGEVEGTAPRFPVEEIQSKPEEPALEKSGKQGSYEASCTNNMEDNADNTSKNSIKPSSETNPIELDSNSDKVTETRDVYTSGLEENPIREIVVYEGGNSFEKKLSDSSASEDQLLEENRMVVYEADNSFEKKLSDSHAFEDQLLEENYRSQEILSPCPLRQAKATCKSDLAGGSLKRKKQSNAIPPQANAKKRSAKKRAHQGLGGVVWNKEDSLQQDEQCTNVAKRSSSYDVGLPPCASSMDHDNDAMTTRNKVRETLRLFQAISRKLLQEEESKMKEPGKPKRIDLLAAKILKEKGKYVNTGKQIIGHVPGVEVGDEFQYFVELNIVGIHRQSQGGIDFVKQGEKVIATSIIASGGYENELGNSDVLSYMGQGGNVMHKGKQPEDQKLERGNLALANSKLVKNPVRVIRGETRSSSSFSESRGGKTYVYDGLYLVEEFRQEPGPHGKLVYKYKLVRIPGQPELAWKVVKKSKMREGLCVRDISQGKETVPICAINTIDSEKPPSFVYEPHVIYPDWCRPIPPKGCGCINGCSESGKCSCAEKNAGEIPYNHNGSIVEAKALVYECGPNCNCLASCHNRVSQHGIKFQLEIFKTESRGWGVRSLNSISSGSFICEYAGELLEDKEAEERKGSDEYLFDIGNNIDSSLWDGLSTIMPDAQSSSSQVVLHSGFTIDAARCGNIGRFINHSCSPNLYAQNVLYDHEDKRIPHIMFFAAENIPPLQELTYHYNYMIDQVRDENGNIKKKICYCGSSECTGRLY